MEETTFNLIAFCAVFVLMFIMAIVGAREAKRDGYLAGQSDALKGDIKISLVEFPDGERKWYFSEQLKDLREHLVIYPRNDKPDEN